VDFNLEVWASIFGSLLEGNGTPTASIHLYSPVPLSLTRAQRGEYPFEVAARLEKPAAPLSRMTA
jgi:hypothetical protein